MFRLFRCKKWAAIAAALMIPAACAAALYLTEARQVSASGDTIKWVDFTPTYDVMRAALDLDIATKDDEVHINWIEALAYLGTRCGGDFSRCRPAALGELRRQLESGKTMAELTDGNRYYGYYLRVYTAVLGNMVGNYQWKHEDKNGQEVMENGYGLIAFSPIARGYGYTHYDDFGSSRSYGYRREHLGNDLMASIGTPVIAVEGGTVEALGWNQYGGWRIGIRSGDGLRYYYYAHLRRGHPYAKDLKQGDRVQAGDVIGYVGMTGYSNTEDTNGMQKPHLHFGMQLIFDESQKDGNGEIWIDVYQIVKLLSARRSSVVESGAGEFIRQYEFFPVE